MKIELKEDLMRMKKKYFKGFFVTLIIIIALVNFFIPPLVVDGVAEQLELC